MGFKTFTASVLTSSDVNTYLMKQAVITCLSSTHPGSPVAGMLIYETDTDTYLYWNGSAWITVFKALASYTPTWTGLTVGNGTQVAEWSLTGKFMNIRIGLTFGSTTVITAGVFVSLPGSITTPNDIAQDLIARVSYNGGANPSLGFADAPPATTTFGVYVANSATTPFTYGRLGSVGITMGTGSQIIVQGTVRIA